MISFQNILFNPKFNIILKKIWYCIGVYKKFKSRHGIGIPTTRGYQHCGEKQVLMLELCWIDITLYYQYYTTY